MNLKQSVGKRLRGHDEDAELNLTAVMNVFLILIPFLLLTAVFVRIAVLELNLPNLNRRSATAQEKPSQTVVLNFLFIRDNEFELRVPDIKFPKLAKKGGLYDWQGLQKQLAQVKKRYPGSQDIIISPDNSIKYDIIISVMDRCRESGFPNISISG